MKKFVFVLLLIFALFRIFLSIKLQLHPDETYYWLWSQNLDWSYFDHSPMVAYFIKLTTIFSSAEFFVRLSSLITFVLGMYIIWKLVKKMFVNEEIAYMSLFIFNLFPMLGASFIITPDIPLIFFWILSLYYIWLAIKEDKLTYWILSGVCIGLAMLSKYNGVILLISLFLFLIISNNYRKLLLTIKPYLTASIAFIIFLPVIIWNYNHNWISFKFQFFHGIPSSSGNFSNVVSYFLGQIAATGLFLGIISIFLPYIYIFCKSDEKKFLATFSFMPLTIFALTSYKSLAEMNWPVCAYPSIAILSAIFFVEKKSKFKNIYLTFSSIFS
ncbi:MAG: glycosyltransferase family 39 protein, partial [Endomicrobiia bacterium]